LLSMHPSEYEGLIRRDGLWFREALRRGLPEEAAELVLDWIGYWKASQRDSSGKGLAAISSAVSPVGTTVVPFIEAFAHGMADEQERDDLTHWLDAMGTPAAQAAAERLRRREGPVESEFGQACKRVYERRQNEADVIRYRRQCELALRQLLGEVLNHGMNAGLLHITEELSLIARELFFEEFRRKPLRWVTTDEDSLMRQHIKKQWPAEADMTLKDRAYDARWLQKLVYTFYRLVQLWLMRPLLAGDFLLLCHAERIDLTAEELTWLTRAQVLHPLVPNGKRGIYHVVQVFALSAVWTAFRAQKFSRSPVLAERVSTFIESVWERLALLTPDYKRLNGYPWLALTQEAREKREQVVTEPSERLWREGLANLAGAYLFTAGVRPVAAKGRPRLAPDDPALVILSELVQDYYEHKRSFWGCVPWLRKVTLDEENPTKVIDYLRAHAPSFATLAQDAGQFYRAWQEKFGGEKAFEQAIGEARATLETLPDEAQNPGAMFAFERMAAQKQVPLANELAEPLSLSTAVLTYAESLSDGPARSVGCWDTRSWTWWLVPRWCFTHPAGAWVLRHASFAFMRVDATGAFTWPANPPELPRK
jgi:hypothetical protein